MASTHSRDREFTAFVERSAGALRRYCLLLTGSLPAADDLLQDALLQVYLALPRVDDLDLLEPYARRTITRTHISRWRQWGRREFPTEVVREPEPVDDTTVEDRDEIWRLLQALPPRQRTAIVLRFYEDLTESDIAETMGCSIGTVKSHLSRGLARLRSDLTADDSHSPSHPLPEGQLR
ncbi:SigE family RNA polymerase sigma factor [Aestuariimicrobium ganziense]|uniref:SigE family RNA polymerase sigma factor n=1 Tax=Aestuariimicrobium ganziense TaxID=2773677 RepID=UPI001943F9E9|nr:SigE family RNA polymerase sigma factor [Aestuariimicrobium ganziense]